MRSLRCFLPLLLSLLAIADASAKTHTSIKLSAGVYIGLDGWREHRKTSTCNVAGGWTETLNYNPTSTSGALTGELEASQSLSTSLNTTKNGTATQYLVRRLSLQHDVKTVGLAETVSLKFTEDYQDFAIKENVYEGACDKDVNYTRPSNATLSGPITITYTVPANVWMVRVTTVGPTASFATANLKVLAGILVPSPESEASDSSAFVYVSPGTNLVKSFSFNLAGNAASGEFSITFEPRVFSAAVAKPEALLKSVDAELAAESGESARRQALLEQLMSSVAGRVAFEQALSGLPTFVVGRLARSEFDLANSPLLGPLATEVRAAAALASFRTALYLLVSVKPFCKPVEVQLVASHANIHVQGLEFATLRLQQAVNFVGTYNSSPYQSMLTYLSRLELGGITYGQVRSDPEKKQQMAQAYDLLSALPEDSLFGQAREQLASVQERFGNLGNGKADGERLIAQLGVVEQAEQAFRTHLFARLRNFQEDSEPGNVVAAKDLAEELIALDKNIRQIGRDIDQNRRILSMRDPSNEESVLLQVGRLLAFNVNIFSGPFTGGAKPIEPLRDAFVAKETLDRKIILPRFVGELESCLLNGGQ